MSDLISQLTPWQWALAALGAYLVGISKTGVAGLGVFAVALFASALPARESTGIVLVILIAADVVAVATYRRHASWPHLLRLFPWTAVGVVGGYLVMGRIDGQTTQRLIGAILILLVALQLWRRRRPGVAPDPTRSHHLLSGLTGVSAGFATMVANAAGSIMNLYLLTMRMPKVVFMGTAAWFFFIINLFKVPFSYSLGLINQESLPISLLLAPVAIAGALTGRILIRHINQQVFEVLALVLTMVAGLRLFFA